MTPRSGSRQLTFRVGSLWPHLSARAGGTAETEAQVAKRDLTRYYALLEGAGRAELRDLHLTQSEASAVCDALNGGYLPYTQAEVLDETPPIDMAGGIAAELADADRLNGLGHKWGVDVPRIITRLRTLTPLGQYALLDAIERFWCTPDRDTGEVLREVGLCE